MQAVQWFRKAAEQGDALGQAYLAESLEKGQGVPKDTAQAIYWFRKAAAQGREEGQAGLRRLRAGN